MNNSLETEIATYDKNLEALLSHAGKFVLIKGSDIVDYFDTYGDALKAGCDRFDDGVFLVKLITQVEQVFCFTRDLAVECPA